MEQQFSQFGLDFFIIGIVAVIAESYGVTCVQYNVKMIRTGAVMMHDCLKVRTLNNIGYLPPIGGIRVRPHGVVTKWPRYI